VLSRRQVLYSALAAATGAAAYSAEVEPRWLQLSRRLVPMRHTGLAAPIRILHLSDLHASAFVPLSLIDEAFSLALAERPDLICLTGDFVTGRDHPAPRAYSRSLRRLADRAPTFAVLGNHDGGVWAAGIGGYPDHRLMERILLEGGVTLLHNSPAALRVRDQLLTLAGLGDYWSEEIDPARAFHGVDAAHPVIVLSHNPDSKARLASAPWDLMLSGHTHGGQVVVPFYGPPFLPVVDTRFVAGLRPWGPRLIHVTRGVGSLYGLRFACRPEAASLLLTPSNAPAPAVPGVREGLR
jgi:predicted MPP superfamily phosphohydrolase